MDSFRGLVEMDREIFLAKFDLASLGRILLVDFNKLTQWETCNRDEFKINRKNQAQAD